MHVSLEIRKGVFQLKLSICFSDTASTSAPDPDPLFMVFLTPDLDLHYQNWSEWHSESYPDPGLDPKNIVQL